MSVTQVEKAARFRGLHSGPGVFVIPNPWDTSARPGYSPGSGPGLATSSAASATALGRRDGGLTRAEALAHARAIIDATDLPVSADLERGFGDAPETVAETDHARRPRRALASHVSVALPCPSGASNSDPPW